MSEHQNEEVTVGEETARPCPGQRLQLARESKGISIDAVSAELRLHPRQIVALETCQVEHLPGQTFIKGYIRSYCRLLGIEADGLIDEYAQFSVEPPPLVHRGMEKQLTSSDTPVRMMTYVIVLLLVGLLAVWWWSQRQEWMAQEPVAETGNVLNIPNQVDVSADTAVTPVGADSATTDNALPLSETNSPAEGEEADSLNAVMDNTAADAAPAIEESVSEPVVTNELRFEFSKDCWTEVTDATGKKVYINLAKAGTSKVIEGTPPYRVFLGFAQGVTVYYNGELYDFKPFIRNTVARFTVGKPAAE